MISPLLKDQIEDAIAGLVVEYDRVLAAAKSEPSEGPGALRLVRLACDDLARVIALLEAARHGGFDVEPPGWSR